MRAEESKRAELRPLGVVLLGYLVSRALFWTLGGVQFDPTTLGWFWQFIDPTLLYDDALKSIWYHHAQPPLFNLYLAGVLKLSAGSPALLCWASFVAMGLLLHGGLYVLMRSIGVSVPCAVFAALLFVVSPASILYESWLFYTYPLACVMVLAAIALARLVSPTGRAVHAACFFVALGIASLTRSLFHPVWLLACTALVWLALSPDRRRWTAWAALPLSLVLLVHAKNAALFGSFSASSWLGMSVAKLATMPIPRDVRAEYVARGEISPISLVEPFSRLDAYPDSYRSVPSPEHPVLTSAMKRTRRRNLNHVAYVGISRQYLEDALALVRIAPGYYASSVAEAWLTFGLPPSDYDFLDANRAGISGYERFYSAVVYGALFMRRSGDDAPAGLPARFSWLWAVAASGALALALRLGGAGLARRVDPERSAPLLFMAGSTLFVAVAGNALELDENNRFRFMVEPLLFALIVWAGARAATALARAMRGTTSG